MVILIICSTPHYVSTTSKFLSLWLKFFSFGGRLNKCGLEIVKTHQSHTLDTFPHWRKIPCGLKWKGVKNIVSSKATFTLTLPWKTGKFAIKIALETPVLCHALTPKTIHLKSIWGLELTQPVRSTPWNQPERTHSWDYRVPMSRLLVKDKLTRGPWTATPALIRVIWRNRA